jgi:2-methylcitrate dehydratase PrpD
VKSEPNLSARIAAHVATVRAEDLPAATQHAASRALLDGLGVMLAASAQSPEILPFAEHARAGGSGPATVLGFGWKTTPVLAAFANGAMAHALDFEDAFDAAPCHPNAALLPAVLAAAQMRLAAGGPAISGPELLAAIAVGCDLVCRLGLSLTRPMEDGGWYPPPILGAFGAAAAAARICRLSERQVLDSFSLMLLQNSCPGEIKYSRDTVLRAVREAFPAQAAMQSTLLAAAGIRGFDQPFEGKAGFFRLFVDGAYDPDVLCDALGQRWWIDQLSFKQWPACRGTHAYIESVQSLRRQPGFDPAAITEIVAVGGIVQRMLALPAESKRQPAVTIDAKFSIPFTIAAAVLDDEVTLDSFDRASLEDPQKRALAAKVTFTERAGWGRERAASGELSIRLADGSTLRHTVEIATGHPSRPLSDEILAAKFVDNAGRARRPIGADAAATLAGTIFSLQTAGDIGPLLAAIQ